MQQNLALEKKFNSKWWGSFQHFEKFMHGKCSFEEMNVEVAKKFSEYLMTATFQNDYDPYRNPWMV